MLKETKDVPFSYSETQMLLYNLSVGMGSGSNYDSELAFVYESPKLLVVPTAATTLGGSVNIFEDVGIAWEKVVHGEQRLKLHRALPPSANLLGNSCITEIIDKGPQKGALITRKMEVRLATGEPLYTMENVLFARGDGGCGGPTSSEIEIHKIPNRSPEFIHETVTSSNQALLYRLNGDRNPLHVDPVVAKRAGFEKPILHGLCSYGIACRAILETLCNYDPDRIKEFNVRFTEPIYPGDTIATEIWRDGDTVTFQCIVRERNVVALSNGCCVLQSKPF